MYSILPLIISAYLNYSVLTSLTLSDSTCNQCLNYVIFLPGSVGWVNTVKYIVNIIKPLLAPVQLRFVHGRAHVCVLENCACHYTVSAVYPHGLGELTCLMLEKSQATPLSSLQKDGLLVFFYTHTLSHTLLLKCPCLNNFHMSSIIKNSSKLQV